MQYVLVSQGIVCQVVDSTFKSNFLQQCVTDGVAPGWTYNATDQTATPPPADPELTPEEQYNAERAAVDFKYSAPWNGVTGGILTLLQMTMTAALCEVPQDSTKIGNIGTQYQTELAAMATELDAIDQKYGV